VSSSSYRRAAAVLLPLACVVAACGGVPSASGPLGDLEGSVFATGSSTVEPITIRVAEEFEEIAPQVVVDVEGPGTGDGFLKFCEGEAEIADASRSIKAEELETCTRNGISFVELQVAIDGIAVVTSPENDGVDCLNYADLYALLGPESEGFDRWADAGDLAAELGSDTELPDSSLDITAPGAESGTYDSFIEIVVAGHAEERGQDEVTRTDYSSAADDNVIVNNVAANPTTLGWVGFAFFEQNPDALKAIGIAEGPEDACVAPNPETIGSGEYPISRPLYIYVNAASAEDPAVGAFVDHYLQYGLDEAAVNAGFVALHDEQKQQVRSIWEAR
jgi:phosphate transport system substrate-binding protein